MCFAVAFGRLHGALPDLLGQQSRRRRRHHRFGDGRSTGLRTPDGCIFRCSETRRSVVTWGDEEGGGDSDNVKSELTGGVDRVVGAGVAFAAVKQDGSVVTWGSPDKGGNSDEVRDQLSGGVREVVGNLGAFAAVKEDGTVVTWGGAGFDSDSD